jgi:hypothetical protein
MFISETNRRQASEPTGAFLQDKEMYTETGFKHTLPVLKTTEKKKKNPLAKAKRERKERRLRERKKR